jgi:hypothetical protein
MLICLSICWWHLLICLSMCWWILLMCRCECADVLVGWCGYGWLLLVCLSMCWWLLLYACRCVDEFCWCVGVEVLMHWHGGAFCWYVCRCVDDSVDKVYILPSLVITAEIYDNSTHSRLNKNHQHHTYRPTPPHQHNKVINTSTASHQQKISTPTYTARSGSGFFEWLSLEVAVYR